MKRVSCDIHPFFMLRLRNRITAFILKKVMYETKDDCIFDV